MQYFFLHRGRVIEINNRNGYLYYLLRDVCGRQVKIVIPKIN